MKLIENLKKQKVQKKYFKTLKKDIKKKYKIEKIETKKEIKKLKKDNSSLDNKEHIKKLKENLYNIKQDNKFLLEEQKNRIIELEPTKLGKVIKTHKKIFSFLLILLFIILFISLSIYEFSKPNYKNDYFSFHFNKDNVYIDDYSDVSNMWIVSTGGGIYSPSLVMIGYTENGSDLDVNQPLLNLQDKFGGEKSDEEKSNTDTYATDDYMLTLDNLKYKVLSKSYKENNKILTVIFINAGDLTDKEQKYLYQVYDTTKFN